MSLGGHPQILGVGGCLPGGAGGWRDLHGDLLAEPGPRGQVEVITAPEAAGVVRLRRSRRSQGSRLPRSASASVPARAATARRAGTSRETACRPGARWYAGRRLPISQLHDLREAVPRGPDDDGLAQVVQL